MLVLADPVNVLMTIDDAIGHDALLLKMDQSFQAFAKFAKLRS